MQKKIDEVEIGDKVIIIKPEIFLDYEYIGAIGILKEVSNSYYFGVVEVASGDTVIVDDTGYVPYSKIISLLF